MLGGQCLKVRWDSQVSFEYYIICLNQLTWPDLWYIDVISLHFREQVSDQRHSVGIKHNQFLSSCDLWFCRCNRLHPVALEINCDCETCVDADACTLHLFLIFPDLTILLFCAHWCSFLCLLFVARWPQLMTIFNHWF